MSMSIVDNTRENLEDVPGSHFKNRSSQPTNPRFNLLSLVLIWRRTFEIKSNRTDLLSKVLYN